MKTRKKDYRETLSNLQIHTKTGKEAFLLEVAKWYKALYPARFEFFKTMLGRLNEVRKNDDGSYTDAKSREVFVRVRVPTELWMFLQRWIPDFGSDSADLDLLRKVWSGFAVGKDRRQRTQLFIDRDFRRVKKSPGQEKDRAIPEEATAGATD